MDGAAMKLKQMAAVLFLVSLVTGVFGADGGTSATALVARVLCVAAGIAAAGCLLVPWIRERRALR